MVGHFVAQDSKTAVFRVEHGATASIRLGAFMLCAKHVPPDGTIVYEGGMFRITVYDINEFGQRVISFRVNQTPDEFFYWKKLRDAAEAQYQRCQAEAVIAVLPRGRVRKRG